MRSRLPGSPLLILFACLVAISAGASSWQRLSSPSLIDHAMLLQRSPRRLLVFGGTVVSTLEPSRTISSKTDVWDLDSSEGWRRLITTGSEPPARSLPLAIYEPAGKRMLVFGGQGASGTLEDLWELSFAIEPPAWTQLSATGTPPDQSSSIDAWPSAYFADAPPRMIVVSHADSARVRVWELSLSGAPVWAERQTVGSPSHRYFPMMAADSAGNRLYFLGIPIVGNLTRELWSYETATGMWTLVNVGTSLPPDWYGATLAVDESANRLVLWCNNACTTVATFDLSVPTDWVHQAASGSTVPSRWHDAAVFDPVARSIFRFGGSSTAPQTTPSQTPPPDLWSLALSGSPERINLGPGAAINPRNDAASATDLNGRFLWIHGGRRWSTQITHFDDLNRFSFDAPAHAEQVKPMGTGPGPRYGHVMIHEPESMRIVLHGGLDSAGALHDDVWTVNTVGPPAWSRLVTTEPGPSPRAEHCAVLDAARRRLVLYGGFDVATFPRHFTDDLWVLDLDGQPAEWTPLPTTGGPPPARSGGVAVFDAASDALIIYGGSGSESGQWGAELNDTWRLDFSSPVPTWQEVATMGPATGGRTQSVSAWDPVRRVMLLASGESSSHFFDERNELWQFDVAANGPWTMLGPAPYVRVAGAAGYDPVTQTMLLATGRSAMCKTCPPFAYTNELYRLHFDATVPVSIAFVDAQVDEGSVTLRWFTGGEESGGASPIEAASVERRASDELAWSVIGQVTRSTGALLEFRDEHARDGTSCGYRLAWWEGSTRHIGGEAWVDVPRIDRAGGRLELRSENPARGRAPWNLEVPLSDSRGTRVVVTDVRGRIVWARTIMPSDGDDPGRPRQVLISGAAVEAPGVYLATIEHEGIRTGVRLVRIGR